MAKYYTERSNELSERYQNENIRRYTVKLNRKTDADMIAYLEGKKAQTTFKMALKEYMKKH